MNTATSIQGLNAPINNPEISEIIINGHKCCWIEKAGRLIEVESPFAHSFELTNWVHQICADLDATVDLSRPCLDGRWGHHRVHIVLPPLTPQIQVTLRRLESSSWDFDRLATNNWASSNAVQCIKNIISERKNFLVLGPTGSGKTSVLDACLTQLLPNERAIVIEDTDELHVPNSVSCKLLTRESHSSLLQDFRLHDLLRQSLRMRPDRLVVGEVRGEEAKDLLLALATGHAGSMGTLHADSPEQALLRLEMLVQLGAPQWSSLTVRRLIHLAIHYLVQVRRAPTGARVLAGVYRLGALESFGILLETVETASLGGSEGLPQHRSLA